jgi:hypothetical protein
MRSRIQSGGPSWFALLASAALMVGSASAVIAVVEEPELTAYVDPTFVPYVDGVDLLEITEADLDEPFVIDDVVDDDAWMEDVEPHERALITVDAERLFEFQPPPLLDDLIDG